MASYKVEWSPSAKRDLKRLTHDVQARITRAVGTLAQDPRSPGTKKLSGEENAYRLRVGDYRVIYSVFDDVVLILITRARHRRDVYLQ